MGASLIATLHDTVPHEICCRILLVVVMVETASLPRPAACTHVYVHASRSRRGMGLTSFALPVGILLYPVWRGRARHHNGLPCTIHSHVLASGRHGYHERRAYCGCACTAWCADSPARRSSTTLRHRPFHRQRRRVECCRHFTLFSIGMFLQLLLFQFCTEQVLQKAGLQMRLAPRTKTGSDDA